MSRKQNSQNFNIMHLDSYVENNFASKIFFLLQYKTERQWILSLLHDGLRETGDYRIFEKRYTFKLLQSFYDSDLSDTATQVCVSHSDYCKTSKKLDTWKM